MRRPIATLIVIGGLVFLAPPALASGDHYCVPPGTNSEQKHYKCPTTTSSTTTTSTSTTSSTTTPAPSVPTPPATEPEAEKGVVAQPKFTG